LHRMTIITSCLLLCGCAAAGVEVKPSQVAQFKRGVTTEQEVEQVLGQLTNLTVTADGGQIWIYSYASMQTRPTTFFPSLDCLPEVQIRANRWRCCTLGRTVN
jgi:hypothetical protein